MKLFIKEKMLSNFAHFDVYDENGNVKYLVDEKRAMVKVGLQLEIRNTQGNLIARIEQKKLSLQPTFFVYVNDILTATIEKKFTMFKQKYVVNELDWTIEGDFTAHQYKISDGLGTNMSISKEYISWGDSFALNMNNSAHEIEALCVVLAIDSVVDDQGNGWSIK